MKLFYLLNTWLLFFITLNFWIFFDRFTYKYQFIFKKDIFINIDKYQLDLYFGIDGISIFFIILTTLLLFLSTLSIFKSFTNNLYEYAIYFIIIELCLLLTFSSIDLFQFFILFESILIPMYLLIGKWGNRFRKIKANFYFFIYTLFGSIMLLFVIISIYLEIGTTNLSILYNILFDLNKERLYWFCIFISFAVKIPMYPLHLWLPEAHVEAPTIGSVILAALLLKLGGFGFIKILLPICTISNIYFSPLVNMLSLLGLLNASLIAIRQVDLKRIIAYSSIGHMNLVVLGIFSINIDGIVGSIFLMIAHGIVSAGLFFSIGILYDKYHTRNLYYFGGFVQLMPIFSIYFIILCFANIGLPGTINFVGELLIFISLIQKNLILTIYATISVILSVLYTITLCNKILFGNLKYNYIHLWTDIYKYEQFIIIPLILLTILLGLLPNYLLNTIFASSWYITQILL